ncbi:MAG: S23 ribosomal protein [uncultured bacterium]|nr:MAG: S23 ribosomal protein [uncultured bacterium]
MKATIKNFHDLDAWKKAHILVLEIYKITAEFPKEEIHGVTSQLRRASSSITANIAEGFARYHFKDKIKFYYNSRGSAAEVQNFLILAKDIGYIDFEKYKILNEMTDEVGRLINGLIKSTEQQINNY